MSAACATPETKNPDLARWERQAQAVTITRDNWGIPHIHGKTDADAVFGMIYAQAEDDFNRIEVNYLNALGRLAEAEGEGEIYRDLRMKLFIDPESLKQQYQASPEWLRQLMNAWADGLNYYLVEHPQVHPKVLRRFEPWMALAFSEGSIGGDIERTLARRCEARRGCRGIGEAHAEARLDRLERGLRAHQHARDHAGGGQRVARDPFGKAQRDFGKRRHIETLGKRLHLLGLDFGLGTQGLVPYDAEAGLRSKRHQHEIARRNLQPFWHQVVVGLIERDRNQHRHPWQGCCGVLAR